MKDESLTNGPPCGGQGAEVQQDDQYQHQHQGHACVDGRDEETHDHTAQQAEDTGVPGEVGECWPGVGKNKSMKKLGSSETNFIDTVSYNYNISGAFKEKAYTVRHD